MSAVWPNGKKSPGDVWHEFGPRKPIWTPNGPTSSFHSGIDIGPWDGAGSTWLLAPDDGIVSHAGYDSIFGNRVVVTTWYGDDKVEFWLCHGRNRSLQVKVGQRVRQGQRLQLMGETGKASGVHIHYEIHVNGVRVDPRKFYASGSAAGGSDEGDEFMAKIDDLWQRWQPGQAGVKEAGDLYLLFAEVLTGVRSMVANLTVAKITEAVWAKPVKRTGGSVSALQELADAKTYGIHANQKLDELLKRPTASVSLTDAQVAALAKSVGEQVALSIAPKVLDAMAKRLES